MKKILYRTFIVTASIVVAIALFLLLTFAGDQSSGPFRNVVGFLQLKVAGIEHSVATRNEGRRNDLVWFQRYKFNKNLINTSDKIIFGIYDDHQSDVLGNIVQLENLLESRFPIIQIYTAWGSKNNQTFPRLMSQAIHNMGSIPMITWEPWLNDFSITTYPELGSMPDPNKNGMRLITTGYFDDYLHNWIDDATRFGAPFFLRFGHEMNDPYRYPWGPHNNQPSDFIDAWKYIYDKFIERGASNAIWIWSPHPAYETFEQFYPGHEYVDWIGLTVLNYGAVAHWSEWWTFSEIVDKSYNVFSEYGKPIMLTEFGSLDVGGNKAEWMTDAFVTMKSAYPSIKSVVFFHAANDYTTTYKILDWSFMNQPEVLDVVKDHVD
jgi:hypothetical protein